MANSRRLPVRDNNTVAAATTSAFAGVNRLAFFMLIALPVLLIASAAFAGPSVATDGFAGYSESVVERTNVWLDILTYVCYLIGVVFCALGISELRRVADGSGGGSLGLRHPVAKLGFGGLFLALPYATAVAQGTMGETKNYSFTLLNPFRFGALSTKDGSLSGYIESGINSVGILVDVASVAAFFIAAFFIVRGLQMLKAHIENPGNQPLAEALKRLAVGGIMFSFPFVVYLVRNTLGIEYTTTGMMSNSGWTSNGGTTGGLDAMMINFVKDLATPAFAAIELFCYIAGTLIILFAMQRLIRTAQDGPRGPLGFGTIMSFLVAGLLISFPQFLALIDNSFGGDSVAKTQVEFLSLASAGVDAAQIQNAKNVFSAVLAFMAVIGFLSVVRGLFLLKSFADGNQQATMMSVVTHIVAGSLCINLGAFINAVQTSLGVTSFAVTFS